MKQVVILAAGLGSRLGDLTRNLPKALIEVSDKPLIDYALAFSSKAGAERQIVVGGYYFADVATRAKAQAPGVVLIENTEFKKGNLVTLGAARESLDSSAGFLLMNVDHIYNPAIADIVGRVMREATDVTAFCDNDRQLTNDDMKVTATDSGRVAAMSKTFAEWDWGYVGMSYVPAAHLSAYWAAAAAATEELGDAIHVESVLTMLAKQGSPPAIADISGHRWLEVDEPHEREHAEGVLRETLWWKDSKTT